MPSRVPNRAHAKRTRLPVWSFARARQRKGDITQLFVDPGSCPCESACGRLCQRVERLKVQETLKLRASSTEGHDCRARLVPTVCRLGRQVANGEVPMDLRHG